MAERADVVIAGGAAVGSATAYYLKKLGFPGSVLVLDKDLGFTESCTARSVGGIRQQFSTEENIRLSQFGLKLLGNLKQEFGPEADVAYREEGYLILASEAGERVLKENSALQQRMGASTVMLDKRGLADRFPWLSTEGVAAGAFGERNEGWLDPWSLMSLFRKGAQAEGAHWRQGEITSLEVCRGRVENVGLTDGERIGCGIFINAAGTGGGSVAALAGIRLPVGPRKRYVFVIDLRDAEEALHRAPLTIDSTGVYFRPESRHFVCGLSPEEDEEPEPIGFDVDYSWFEERVWPGLAYRVPAFEAVKVINAWCGHYDYNEFDQNAVIGPHPEITNFYFNNGFSGHGLQQSPAAGNAMAELVVHGEFRTIDLRRFSYERIRDNRPLKEINVI